MSDTTTENPSPGIEEQNLMHFRSDEIKKVIDEFRRSTAASIAV